MASLNETLFQYIHAFAGESLGFDAFVIFSAKFLVLWMIAALFLTVVWFFYLEEFKYKLPVEAPRRWMRFACYAFFSLLAGVLAWAAAEVIKYLYPADRPFLALSGITPLFEHGARDAFPSGHAAFSFALAASLFFYNKKLGATLLFVALIISLARVSAGIHWPLDILAGALLGIFITLLAYFLAYKFKK